MGFSTPSTWNLVDSFLWHDYFKDAVWHCDVDKISPSLLITSEDDKKYLASLSELELEAVVADHFHQFKRVEELRKALEVAQQSGHYGEAPLGGEEVVKAVWEIKMLKVVVETTL